MSTCMTARRALESYCDAFQRREAGQFDGLFADNAVFDLPLNEERLTGREQILRGIRSALSGLRDIQIELDHVIENGNAVFAEGRFWANQIGVPPEANGTPAR